MKQDKLGERQRAEVDDKESLTYEEHIEEPDYAVELGEAVERARPSMFSPSLFRLYGVLTLLYLCSIFDGFDGSLMSSINVMPSYLQFFGLKSASSGSGLTFAMTTIGGIAVFPFTAPLNDKFGRRAGICVGCILITLGSIIMPLSVNHNMFLGGRFCLGFGFGFLNTSAPVLVCEIAHPYWRGAQTGLYNSFWGIGAIVASWTCYGVSHLTGNIAWRLPLWLPLISSVPVALAIFLMPESPRWLFAQGRIDEARKVLTQYHGEGDPNNVFVKLQMAEMAQQIELHGSDKVSWDYRALFRRRSDRRRAACYVVIVVVNVWSGSSLMGSYFPVMMEIAGIKSTNELLLLNSLNQVFPWVSGMAGGLCANRLGRRPALLTTIGFGVCCFALMFGLVRLSTTSNSVPASHASIVFCFAFPVVIGFGWTPLTTMYVTETLPTETRVKGVMLAHISASAASVVSTYGAGTALGNIGYWYYLFFVGWNSLVMIYIYFFFVETRGRTLEEINIIFDDPKPVKKSLEKRNTALIAKALTGKDVL